MQNGLGEPQTVVVLGGNSEIGRAIAQRLTGAGAKRIVLAVRETSSVSIAELGGVPVAVEAFDAADMASHTAFAEHLSAVYGDLDVVIAAFGVLGDQQQFDADPAAAAAAVHVNYTGMVSSGLAIADRLRRQGHGALIILSSVAGERVRKANFVYGSSKAGLDGFAQGLGDALDGSGARVLVVRPGFVHSAMTKGLKAAPFATTPDKVAEVTAAGLRRGRRTVWAPGILRLVFMVFRHLPGPVWRRLPI